MRKLFIIFSFMVSQFIFGQEDSKVFKRNNLEDFYTYIDKNFNKNLINQNNTIPFIIYYDEKGKIFDFVFEKQVESNVKNELIRVLQPTIFDMTDQVNSYIVKMAINLYLNKEESIKGSTKTHWFSKDSFNSSLKDSVPITFSETKNFGVADVNNQNSIYNAYGLEVKPEYPGGIQEFYKYIGSKFKVPKSREFKGGKVFVQFVIEKDGSLSDIKVLKDAGFGTRDEAIRVLKKCKKWKPAEQQGEKVRCSYTLPINLQGNK